MPLQNLKLWAVTIVFGCLAITGSLHAENSVSRVRKAVLKSTLNQPGTKPFHLKADFAPSRPGENDAGHTGEVEIWWNSPTQWRREIHTPEFSQTEIVNENADWQKNHGSYFPEWLREIVTALIEPVPPLEATLQQIKNADEKHLLGSTYYSWMIPSSNGTESSTIGASIALNDSTGLLFYGGAAGWGGLYKDYRDFHGRIVARTVAAGSPEMTARITTLEDLGTPAASFFDATQPGGDLHPIHTLVVNELDIRKNLLSSAEPNWPPIKDGPLSGVLTTTVAIDREGSIHEVHSPVSANPGANDAAMAWVKSLHFNPYLLNGEPVQVVARLTIPFKTVRPAGTEVFDTARNYFERGRNLGFLSAGNGPPYVLRGEFEAKGTSGPVQTGKYEDTWINASQWRREAWFGKSHLVRSRNGEKTYELAEGPDARILALTFQLIEPIPAIDTFVESDWRINSESVERVKTVRVLSGYESPDGKLDREHARAFWFNQSGQLIQTFFSGIKTIRADFGDYEGLNIAHEIGVFSEDHLVMKIKVTEVVKAETPANNFFEIKGHQKPHEFTSEMR